MDKKFAQKLIAKTRDDYNKIAEPFSSSRSAFNWSHVAAAIEKLQIIKSSKVLDLGCGNGRVLDILGKFEINYTGLDLSPKLIDLAQKKYPAEKFIVGNLLDTPFLENEFDLVLSLATLHHIPSEEQRISAFSEIYRVLKPSGMVLITVWYFWDKPKFKEEMTAKLLNQKSNKANLEYGDFLKPWKDNQGNILAERYFHAWEKDELKELLAQVGFIDIRLSDNKDDKNNNLIVTAQKLKSNSG